MMTITAANVREIQQDGDWFVFLLEDNYSAGAQNELRDCLGAFIKDIGRRNWVVEGHMHEKDEFRSTVFHEFKLYLTDYSDFKRFPSPALLIVDGLPQKRNVDELIRIVIPLQKIYEHPGDTARLLKDLAVTLKEPDAAQQLKKYDRKRLVEVWGWLTRYAVLGIGILGAVADAVALLQQARGG